MTTIDEQIKRQEETKARAEKKLKSLRQKRAIKKIKDENLAYKVQLSELQKLRSELDTWKSWAVNIQDEKHAVILRDEVKRQIDEILKNKN